MTDRHGIADPQACGQCECCEAWRGVRDDLTRERDEARAKRDHIQSLLRGLPTWLAQPDSPQAAEFRVQLRVALEELDA